VPTDSRSLSPHDQVQYQRTAVSNGVGKAADINNGCHMCECCRTRLANQCSLRLLAPVEDPVEEGTIDIDESEEVESMKISTDPGQPTQEQIEQHRVCGHTPYRSWCKFCVMGRGLGAQHRTGPKSLIPIIGMDYFYLTRGGVKTRSELEYPDSAEGQQQLEI
jgi:hypothetical protein